MEACHKRCVCSLFFLQLLLLPSLISSSSSKTLQGSDSHPPRSQIVATTTDNEAFSGKESDATIGSYYNVGGRKMRGVKTVDDMGATNIDEDMKKKEKKKICKEGAVKVGVESCRKKKQHRVGYGGGEEDSKVVEEAGFVAFSADYHTPRHHPPKNN